MPYRKIDNQGVKCYYFPAYVIFKVKNITDFDFESLAASINGVLIIDILLDYRDKFSPEVNNLDEEQVRNALENIFNFKFDPKGADKLVKE
jgi:tryptophan synthase alpha subunit